MNYITNPSEIEKRSFEIISEQLADREFDPENINVIKRVIHTTADFDFADNLVFSEGAAVFAKELLEKNSAYYCFCTSERLDAVRKEREAAHTSESGYDRFCRNISI